MTILKNNTRERFQKVVWLSFLLKEWEKFHLTHRFFTEDKASKEKEKEREKPLVNTSVFTEDKASKEKEKEREKPLELTKEVEEKK